MTQIVDLSVQKTFFLVRNQVETGLLVKKQVCFPDADLKINFLFKRFLKFGVNGLEQSKKDFWILHHHYHS